ncbi:MAG: hypothetical protein KFB93_06380 [Simkaniaceae bacterium]|jgi:hypothetical protein|nr:MAG: hypothetical protein KFB93_06380 [Simkaniaceae bacterium]
MFRKLPFLLIPFLLFASPPKQKAWQNPWFTGPLLAPSPTVNELKQVTWQPYLFVTCNFGVYDRHWKRQNIPNMWIVQPLLDITYGISSFMDLEVTPAFSYQTRKGSSSIRMNDTPLYLGIQALREKENSWIPDLRISLQTIFPFGQYDKGNPKKHQTDLTGKGSYQTGINFDFQKTFNLAPEHYFRLRWSINSILYLSVAHIQGISSYGGSPDTRGKVYPGRVYTFYLSGEYTITHNWVFAFDTEYVYAIKDRFSGRQGDTDRVGGPTSHQISFAPAIEYNYSANFGIIAGTWFTLAGKNSTQFASGVISAVISY